MTSSEPDGFVSITGALTDAWNRMQTILFGPFDLGKWMALGFTAWLAGLAQGTRSFGWNVGGGSDSNNSDAWASSGSSIGNVAVDGFASASSRFGVDARVDWPDWGRWAQWPLDHPLWFAAGVFGCFALVAILILVLWLSSRGKFMFLDNVVHDRAEVARPWRRYRRLANSHFFFQLAFLGAILCTALLAATIAALAGASLGAPGAPSLAWLLLIPVILLAIIALAYVQYFLDGFVVPLMHRHDLSVLEAWSRFGDIFRRHPWALLLSGPFLLVLLIAAMILVVIAGVLTCCIGLILVIIPYIGTVVLLPIPVVYRAFTVALLEQIEPGYFPSDASPPPLAPNP